MSRFLPIVSWIRSYEPRWLRADVVAGLTIMALLVPEGMAYAELAGVGPEAAFYAAPIGLLLYAVFGTSRQLVVAVSSAIAVMSASIVAELTPPGTEEFVAMTAMLAVVAGVVGIVAGFFRLGRIARFFSGSVLAGFVSGIAATIIIKQLPKVLGLESEGGNAWERLEELARHLGDVHGNTLIVGATTIVLMLALERWFHRIPAALVALVYGIGVVTLFDLDDRGVHVVGEIPSGLALPQVPDVAVADLWALIPGAIAITLVMFAEAVGPARSFAARHGYRLRDDQELIGMGAANLGAGLFQGFSIGASLSKSAAADAAGGKTQLAGIVAAAATALVALFLTPLFERLPEAALGAIVIVAVLGMLKIGELSRLFRLRRVDFGLAAIAFLGVLTFEEVVVGLLIAVLASLVALIMRTRDPQISELGRVPGTLAFANVRHHDDAIVAKRVVVLRPDETIFFANADGLREGIHGRVEAAERRIDSVILDLEMTNELDVPGAEMLEELHSELNRLGVQLMLAGVHAPALDLLERSGALEAITSDHIYSTVADAVLALDEAAPDTLLAADVGAIVARLRELAGLAARHRGEMTDEQRATVAESEALLGAVDADEERPDA